jgi:hypothetical protein
LCTRVTKKKKTRIERLKEKNWKQSVKFCSVSQLPLVALCTAATLPCFLQLSEIASLVELSRPGGVVGIQHVELDAGNEDATDVGACGVPESVFSRKARRHSQAEISGRPTPQCRVSTSVGKLCKHSERQERPVPLTPVTPRDPWLELRSSAPIDNFVKERLNLLFELL